MRVCFIADGAFGEEWSREFSCESGWGTGWRGIGGIAFVFLHEGAA